MSDSTTLFVDILRWAWAPSTTFFVALLLKWRERQLQMTDELRELKISVISKDDARKLVREELISIQLSVLKMTDILVQLQIETARLATMLNEREPSK